MKLPQITEINIEDLFADMNADVNEIESTVKIVCASLRAPKYDQPDLSDIDNILFSLIGKLSNLKNNLRIMEEFK